MISTQQAYERVSGLTQAEVRELTRRRILAEDTAPIGGAHLDEPPEDLVIQLLRNSDLSNHIREAVIAGCRDVYSRLIAWLATGDRSDSDGDADQMLTRLCRVVDVAEPCELHAHADAMLSLAIDRADVSSSVLSAAVRAAMVFGRSPGHVSLWERVLQRPEVAAYAFNALLEIDPHAERIERALATLWRRQLADRWNVDTAFLMRRAVRKRGSEAIVPQVLHALGEESSRCAQEPELSDLLATELRRREWSSDWIRFMGRHRAPSGPSQNAVFLAYGGGEMPAVVTQLKEYLLRWGLHVVQAEPGGLGSGMLATIEAIKHCAAVVAVCTPGDEWADGTCRPRGNVLLEIGLAIGLLGGLERLAIFQQENVRLPAYLAGALTTTFQDNIEDAVSRLTGKLPLT